MDLFLIARCKHQITSKGTLGKYGALLGDNSEKWWCFVMMKWNIHGKNYFKMPYFYRFGSVVVSVFVSSDFISMLNSLFLVYRQ